MNVEQLHLVLQQSFSADASVRHPAEETIRNLKHLPGAVQLLLQVAAEKQVRFEVRQAAAIQLKNICRECWVERTHSLPYYYDSSTTTTSNGSSSPQQQQKPTLLSNEDKAAVKDGVVRALLEEPEKSVRDLFTEAMHTMLVHDFPESWPGLVPYILSTLQQGMQQIILVNPTTGVVEISTLHNPVICLTVHNALLALRKVCKRYEYKSREQRGPLNIIVKESFPLLLPLATHLVNMQASATQHGGTSAAMILKQVLKIFWSSTQFYLPEGCAGDGGRSDAIETGTGGSLTTASSATSSGSGTTDQGAAALSDAASCSSIGLARPEALQPWFDVLTRALQIPLPEEDQPKDLQARNAWPWWKVKKRAVQIMSRLFSRYGIPNYAGDDIPAKEFALHFSQRTAPQFLGPILDTLNLRPTGRFCPDRVVHLCLTFVDLAVEISSTYKLIKPHLDGILGHVCFPTMCLNPDDIDCFENDPVEYVHKQNSPVADFYDPRVSAITLVKDLVRHRGQDVTQFLLGRMTEIIQRYNSNPGQALSLQDHIEKDGALLTFGSLSVFLLSKEKYAKEVEGLLVTSVFPDFNSPVAFLRYRACWMVQQFATVPWSDDGTQLRNLLQLVLQRLSDPALPVQIQASIALRFLIEVDGAESTLLPVLPQLLTEYFRIMNEIGNDEVVSALQVLLDKFGDHIEPHAVALVKELSNAFLQYCSAGEDEDDDDAALAAAQCLECIATVLKGVCSKESMLATLEPLLLPLVLRILGNDGDLIEYLECALDILTFLTYFQSNLSMELWQAFPLIYVAFDQWAYDYLSMMVPCLQSYISKAPDIFLAGVAQLPHLQQQGQNPDGSPAPAAAAAPTISYLDLVVSMASKTVTNDRASEPECRYALSLLMCVLHNCPGKVDPYIPFVNDIILGKLGQQIHSQVPLTRIAIYQVLGSALYYQPQLELMELEKRGVTGQVFGQWLIDCDSMSRWLPRKCTILGFASIFSMPTATFPPSITNILPQLFAKAVKVTLEQYQDENPDDDALVTDNTDTGGGGALNTTSGADQNAEGRATSMTTSSNFEEDVGDLDQGFDENEDVTNEVDEAYRKALSGVKNWDDDMAKFLMGEFDEDGEDVDEDYSSPLVDQVDEKLLLADIFKVASTREPEAYQQIQAALPPEDVASCQRLFVIVDAVRADQAARQASQQQ